MFLVVWGHCLQNMVPVSDYLYTSPVAEWIYSFHMALFMMVSGYFAFSSLKKHLNEVIEKRAVQLLLPSVTWFLILRSLALLSHHQLFTLYGLNELFTGMFVSGWFLKSLFCCYLIVMVGSWIATRGKMMFVLYVLAILSMGLILNYSHTFAMLPFFGAGLLFKKYEQGVYENAKVLLPACLCVWVALLLLTDISDYVIYNNPFKFTSGGVISWLLRTILGVTGGISIILLIKSLCEKKKSPVLNQIANIGGMTLGIYCIQIFMAELGVRVFAPYMKTIPTWVMDLVITPLTAAAIIIVCCVIIRIIRKNKYCKVLLLGEQTK